MSCIMHSIPDSIGTRYEIRYELATTVGDGTRSLHWLHLPAPTLDFVMNLHLPFIYLATGLSYSTVPFVMHLIVLYDSYEYCTVQQCNKKSIQYS